MAAVRLTQAERIEALKHYYKERNASETALHLSKTFNRPQPSHTSILRLVSKFEETGSVQDVKRTGRPSLCKDADFQAIVANQIDPITPNSTRRITAHIKGIGGDNPYYNLSHSTVHLTLKKMGLKPYIPRLIHALHEDDFDRRVEFSETFLNLLGQDPDIIHRVLWSDEATFKLSGHLNRHNCIYWSADNHHVVIEKEVNLPGLTVWCGMHSGGVFGPYFFDETVTGQTYLTMLNDWLWPQIRHENFIFQQDGAPPHYSTIVRSWLDDKFTNAWIGRRGWIEWAPRSPDMTPLDFFFWGFIKDKVYANKPTTIHQLRQAITNAITNNIDANLCRKVCSSVPGRLVRCMQTGGHHIENEMQ